MSTDAPGLGGRGGGPGAIALVGALLLLAPTAVTGQALRVAGTVVDSLTGTPIPGARVTLRPSNAILVTTISDSVGQFLVAGGEPPAQLSISAMGMMPRSVDVATSGQIDLGVVWMHPAPIGLPGLDVEGTSTCDAPHEELQRGYGLIERLRPQLLQIARHDNDPAYEYVVEIVRTVREFIGWEQARWRWVPDTVRVRLPFAMPVHEPGELHARGFAVAVNDSVNEYRAPNAAWLASHQFQDSYCLAWFGSESGGAGGRVGVRFWPKAPGAAVTVAGTLWLDPRDRPVRVDFEYVSLEDFVRMHELPWLLRYFQMREGTLRIPMRALDLANQRHGGSVTFREVADGVRVTSAWEIRGVRLASRSLWEMGELVAVWPESQPLVASGRLLALVPVGEP